MKDETTNCPLCNRIYSFLWPRVTTYPNGEKVDMCIPCGVLEDKKLSTATTIPPIGS